MPDVWRGGLWGNLWDKGTQLGQVKSTFSLHQNLYIIRLHQVAWHQGPRHRASQVRIQIWSALQPHFCSRFVVSFIFEIIFLDHTLLWYFFGKGARLQPHFCSVTHLSNHNLCIFYFWIFGILMYQVYFIKTGEAKHWQRSAVAATLLFFTFTHFWCHSTHSSFIYLISGSLIFDILIL